MKVWFITGGNKGLGAAIAQEALASGYQVVATARQVEGAEKRWAHTIACSSCRST